MSTSGVLRAAVAAAVVVLAAMVAEGQGLIREDSIPLGRFQLRPLVAASWETDDNLFYQPADRAVADDLWRLRADLELRMPLRQSWLELRWQPEYRQYGHFDPELDVSHRLDLDGELRFANGLRLTPRLGYLRSSSDTGAVDPGGVLTFIDDPYRRWNAALAVEHYVTASDGFAARVEGTNLTYDDPDQLYFDYRQRAVGVAWLRELQPTLRLELELARGDFELVGEEVFPLYSLRDSTSNELGVRLRGRVTRMLTSTLRVGYRRTTFTGSIDGQTIPDLATWIASGDLAWLLSRDLRLVAGLMRSDYPSVGGLYPYYFATAIRLGAFLDRNRWRASLQVRRQRNDFEAFGSFLPARQDDDTVYVLDGELEIARRLVLEGEVRWWDRESGPVYSFDSTRIRVGIRYGIDRRGR